MAGFLTGSREQTEPAEKGSRKITEGNRGLWHALLQVLLWDALLGVAEGHMSRSGK